LSAFQKSNFLIALISPSGGGKTAILNEVLKHNSNISYSISFTTRPPRFNETNDVDYHFISQAEFDEIKAENGFLENARVHDFCYGTSRRFVEAELEKGHHILMDIDVRGALQIMEKNIDLVTIFILPPSQNELLRRLKARKTETESVLERRLKTAENEMREIRHFDYLVINDNLEQAVAEVEQIIAVEENKVKRYKNIYETYYGGK